MPCSGTTSGEHCGGVSTILVYEITSYRGCHLEFDNEPIQQQLMLLSTSRDEQIIGKPWDFQEKHDTTKFFKSIQHGETSHQNGVPPRSCEQ